MTEPRIGVVVYDRATRPDAAFRDAVARLRARGLHVGGLLQDGKDGEDGFGGSCCTTLQLEDIATGRRVELFENRGAGTRGCRLDPAGLAEASGWLREAIAARPDVLFVNRFGRQEAEGRGLLDDIAAAVLAEIPIVVPVAAALLPQWRAFAGDEWIVLQDCRELEAWCAAQLDAGAASIAVGAAA